MSSIFQPKERAAIFVDGSNHMEACRTLGFNFDYQAFLKKMKKDYALRRAFYFTAVRPTESMNPGLRSLLDWLDYNGYHLVTKRTKEFLDANGARMIKGNMDSEIIIRAMMMTPFIDVAIFLTGDGDFSALFEQMQMQDTKVIVLSTRSVIADEIRRSADEFIELANMRQDFQRELVAAEQEQQC